MSHNRSLLTAACFAAVFVACASDSASAQRVVNPRGRYFPLDQLTAPGVTAQWHTLSAGTQIGSPQAVRVELPTGGTVSFFDSNGNEAEVQPAPAQASLAVGHLYRLKLTNIPKFPNVTLYPSIEVLDKLHPPASLQDRYPVPVSITKDEIEAAASGRFITKVIYLEAPRRAVGKRRTLPEATTTMPNSINLFAEADRLGRPMLILRLGSRTPGQSGASTGFFGNGGPVMSSPIYSQPTVIDRSAKLNSAGRVRVSLAQHTPSIGK